MTITNFFHVSPVLLRVVGYQEDVEPVDLTVTYKGRLWEHEAEECKELLRSMSELSSAMHNVKGKTKDAIGVSGIHKLVFILFDILCSATMPYLVSTLPISRISTSQVLKLMIELDNADHMVS